METYKVKSQGWYNNLTDIQKEEIFGKGLMRPSDESILNKYKQHHEVNSDLEEAEEYAASIKNRKEYFHQTEFLVKAFMAGVEWAKKHPKIEEN